jgi:secreted PhoX family phosphatase
LSPPTRRARGAFCRRSPTGPLRRKRDQRGIEVLALPAGFSYVTFGHTGSIMSDGNPTPLALDGMGAFGGGRHRHHRRHRRHRHHVRLIRNSEDRNPVGVTGGVLGDPAARYDPDAYGGTTTLVYDERRRELVRDFVSLNGTTVNCAGGISYRRRSWLTGEESVRGPDASDPAERFPKRHGYLFETPVRRGPDELEVGVPILHAGRFSHEAAAVDQRTGIVYETEDPGTGVGAGFYRYIPDDPDDLAAGGKLQMLAIRGQPQVDLREGRRRRERLPVVWVDIDEPDPELTGVKDPRSTFNQGRAKGGATFNRLEGCWEDDGTIFFVSTSGGDVKNGDVNSDGYAEGFGQVWAYRSRRDGDVLVLLYESPAGAELDSPDNLTVTPRGGLIACEDDASSDDEGHAPAGAGDHEREPVDRPHAARAGLRVRSQRPQRVRARGVLLQPEWPDAVLQHLRPCALRRGRGRGDDLRRHRAVAPWAVVTGGAAG